MLLNEYVDPQDELRDQIQVQPIEQDPFEAAEIRDRNEMAAGWPGDGSGTDDLADYNQNEADDYSNE
jgi:hypothetical protein